MTCPNNNFNANRPPTGNDDSCNTSGEGIFSAGSYWLYDPTAAGANTALYGECERLFQRIGDTCTMDQWVEISILSVRREIVDPTAADCCPAGTLWINETINSVFISLADLDSDPIVCDWCQICAETTLVEAEQSMDFLVPTATWTQIPYGTELTDSLGEWDAGAYTFTAASDKIVLLCAGWSFASHIPLANVTPGSIRDYGARAVVNGIQVGNFARQNTFTPFAATSVQVINDTGCIILELQAGDVVSIELFHDDTQGALTANVNLPEWTKLKIKEFKP